MVEPTFAVVYVLDGLPARFCKIVCISVKLRQSRAFAGARKFVAVVPIVVTHPVFDY